MEKNIFEGARFGDKFLTRDGRTAVVVNAEKYTIQLFVENEISPTVYEIRCNGWANCYEDEPDYKWRTDVDIVSRYQEPVNEKKLDELAENYIKITMPVDYAKSLTDKGYKEFLEEVKKDFKAGYYKAKEE